MTKAWKLALPTVGMSARPFSAITGPAGAFVASAMRVGWEVPSPSMILTQRGELLDLDVVCPKQLLKLAQKDLRELEAASSSTAKRIGGPPDLGTSE